MENTFASAGKNAGFYCLLFCLLLGVAIILTASPVQAETPLTANISWSTTSSSGPWSTQDTIWTYCGTTIYFRARNATDTANASVQDCDCPIGKPKVWDTANYSWDWNYQIGTHDDDALGVTANKTYNAPGNRIVRLKVWDNAGVGKTNDLDVSDTVTVNVILVQETDSMGAGGSCSAADHVPCFTGSVSYYMYEAWATANYYLVVDGDHDTDCTYYEYIWDVKTYAGMCAYLDSYQSEDPHLYIMGGHRYSVYDQSVGGACWACMYSMIFMCCAGEPYTSATAAAAILHEGACHDDTVGIFLDEEDGHCETANDACCCKAVIDNDVTEPIFCSTCQTALKARQNLDN